MQLDRAAQLTRTLSKPGRDAYLLGNRLAVYLHRYPLRQCLVPVPTDIAGAWPDAVERGLLKRVGNRLMVA